MTLRDSEIVRQEIEAGGPKAVVSGCIWGCPLCPQGGRYSSTCRYRAIDQLHNEDKARWFNRLTKEQYEEFAKEHSDCIGRFEQ